MNQHARFSYRNLDELRADIDRLGLTSDLPLADQQDDLEILFEPVAFGTLACPNRLGVHPMEGCDGRTDGSPSNLTYRRYERFGAGGAGLIWCEACAVLPEARANPRQLWIHQENLPAFRQLVERTRNATARAGTAQPILVLQLTHSGRYSRPHGQPRPIIAHHSPALDAHQNLPPDYPLISDQQLHRVQDAFLAAAQLACEAGFDAVDIKSCHGYLINELLACFTRPDSRYGGNFENRTRFLRETARRIRNSLSTTELTCRLNAYDAIAYPYGWGVDRNDVRQPDLSEPLELINRLQRIGLGVINISAGNPYYNPHVGRPFDEPVKGGYLPDEHPLHGVARMVRIARQIQLACPDISVVGSGYSWLRHFFPYLAVEVIRRGWASLIALGRGAFAYPNFARDLYQRGRLDPLAVCISCSSCTQLMRDGARAGCVVRDPHIYGPIYRQARRRDPDEIRRLAQQCRQCINPNCAAACPASIDVPAFLKAVADGQEQLAYRILRRSNPLPELCGLVCPTEVLCQGACLQQWLADAAVPIADIQRYIAERARQQGWTALDLSARPTGRRIAVVGAGPAGLACAARVLEYGHHVTIFEKRARPGGKALRTIPADRLDHQRAAAEIEAIFAPANTARLQWRLNSPLSQHYRLDQLLAEGFEAVYLAFGLGQPASLRPHQKRPDGVLDALEFLEQMNRDETLRIDGKVAVLGGGNTAIDAACLASHRGAQDVYLIYRRSLQQMPAWPDQLRRCVEAGLHLLLLTQPIGYELDKQGRLRAVRVIRTELARPDHTGRRRPIPVPNSQHTIPVQYCIEALGERPAAGLSNLLAGVKLGHDGLVAVGHDAAAQNPFTFQTSRDGVFAGGELVNGPTTVVQAVTEGLAAADQIHRYLQARHHGRRG